MKYLILLAVVACSGCVMIVNYAPSASRASLYAHEQSASNMVVNQDIPVTAQLAQKLTGTIGASFDGNTVKGIEATTTVSPTLTTTANLNSSTNTVTGK